MSRYKTNQDGSLADQTPFFASTWMTLFYILRENFNDRWSPPEPGPVNSSRVEEK